MSRGKVSPTSPCISRFRRTYTVTAQRDSSQRGEPVFTVCVVPVGSVLSTLTSITTASRSFQEESHASSLEHPGLITSLVDIHSDFSGAGTRVDAESQSRLPSSNGGDSNKFPTDSKVNDSASGNSVSQYSYIAPCHQHKVDPGTEDMRSAEVSAVGQSGWGGKASPSQFEANSTSCVDEVRSLGCDWDAPTVERRTTHSKSPMAMSAPGEERNRPDMDRKQRQASQHISFQYLRQLLPVLRGPFMIFY